MSSLIDKEILILNQISKTPSASQRELSRMTRISLGLINIILRSLLKKGHMRVSPLNKRKLSYVLTQEGLLEAIKGNHLQLEGIIQKYKSLQTDLAGLLKKVEAFQDTEYPHPASATITPLISDFPNFGGDTTNGIEKVGA